MTELKQQIIDEISDWELEEFTDATIEEVADDVMYNMSTYEEDLETALQHTNDKIMDGCL